MLPAGSRLHTSDEFAAVVRSGRRAGTRHLVVHVLATGRSAAPRAGFVVSSKVGNAVVRHRVTRRLRPLVRQELAGLAAGVDVVVRALPAAASASTADLGRDLRSGLAAAARKRAAAERRPVTGRPVTARPLSGQSGTPEWEATDLATGPAKGGASR